VRDMRCLVVADVHSNLEALRAVIADAEADGGFERVLCLGDVVGYGPDPSECLALLRSYPHAAVAGNHDLAAIGELSVDTFNPAARAAALWTRHRLTPDEQAYLRANPLRHEESGATLVHGTPREPVWEYFLPWLMPPQVTDECFSLFDTPLCLLGHSHLPFACDEAGIVTPLQPGMTLAVDGARTIMNPGSVGQPRDGDPRAAYAVYDTEACSLTHHRVPYDIERTQLKMAEAGLPDSLAVRLSFGR
ncbi:MAG: metallophosphoesterase family protein, partial [Chloroflexota bacterium]|nr:metallophosphoesterase family protein [Chloroflexota bacterium]